jgi:organic hydroperoxide reductase OsmC/OhrA
MLDAPATEQGMAREHRYRLEVAWTGDRGTGTSGYGSYGREHETRAAGKPTLPGSSDPAFRGDPARWNPEELLVASLSACHMLWYLHLCADAGVVVTGYLDRAEGIMVESAAGTAKFERVILRPLVTLAPGTDPAKARSLHDEAHRRCFIANSVNFAVEHAPEFVDG